MKISVVGLGKLGACTAACMSFKGWEVIGLDINKEFVNAINNGKAPVLEPELQEKITGSNGRLTATQDFSVLIEKTGITFLIVPTPSREDHNFSSKYLEDALTHLGKELKVSKKESHIFVIVSTVSPGTCEEILIPLLERESGRNLNEGFSLCYNPEFIALGSVVRDFLNPDMLLIGESNREAGKVLASIYEIVCESKPKYSHMSLVSAEITKISINSYVTMKISFANTLANLCERIPNSNVDDITTAMGADRRISPYYLKGGISFGGPCFPRDNRAFTSFAKKYGLQAILAESTDKVNQRQIDHLVDLTIKYISESKNKTVSILGLTYKINTPVIEESPGIKIIQKIIKLNDVEVICYDPLANDNARAIFGDNILYASSVTECLNNSSIAVITTQYDEFKNLNSNYFVNNPMTIIDCWRILHKDQLGSNVNYIPIGEYSK